MITRRTRDIAGKVMAGSMLAFMLLLSVSVTREAFAATDPTKYTALTTIPGFTVANQVTNPIEKIKNLYGVAIGIAAVLAVVMIIYAGLEYSTAEAIYGKSGAKDKLLGAFSGLGLLLGSYLLLRTINVDLVNINLDLGAPVKGDIVASGAVANFQKQMLQNASAALTAVTAAETKVKTATAEKTALQTNLDKINSDLSKIQNAASPEARALVAEAEKIRLDIAATEQKLLNSKIEIVTGKIVQTENQSAEILIRKLESGKTEEAQSLFNTARITMEQHATKLKTDGATDTEIKIIDGKIAAVNLINEQYLDLYKTSSLVPRELGLNTGVQDIYTKSISTYTTYKNTIETNAQKLKDSGATDETIAAFRTKSAQQVALLEQKLPITTACPNNNYRADVTAQGTRIVCK